MGFTTGVVPTHLDFFRIHPIRRTRRYRSGSTVDQDIIDAIGGGLDAVEDETDEGEDGDDEEGDELETTGVVESFSSTELVLTDGSRYVITSSTEIESSLRVGNRVDVEYMVSNGQRIALEID